MRTAESLCREFRFRLALLTIVLAAWAVLPALAGAPAIRMDVAREVSLLEHRFFFKQYAHDPLEKRLERLELLVYGATQAGSNEARAERLRKTVADKDRQASAPAHQGADGSAGAPTKKPLGSSQYPILNTFEWRVFKKTYPGETLDQRLERLETKLFGQPSQAMAYADRVERLKRTLGIDVAQSVPAGPLGPRPKAGPRSPVPGEPPWMGGFPFAPDQLPPGEFRMPPFSQIAPPLAEMLREFEGQMDQLMKLPPGAYRWHYSFDPEKGQWIERHPSGKGKSHSAPAERLPGGAPSAPSSIPPYYDPNSI